jgi:hypothetical protein
MSQDMDPKAAKVLETTTELLENKLQERLKEKWPEYRETENTASQREILTNHYRRMATRSARAWLPPTGDQELRAVESLLLDYIEAREQGEGDGSDVAHRVGTQGLTNLGIALANVLQAVEGGNQASRMAAIEWVADALARGEDSVQILEAAVSYEGATRTADESVDGF